jgi:hypothetical protein
VIDSNDWLASIDLDAVKSAPRAKGSGSGSGSGSGRKKTRRIVYGEPSRLAPPFPKGRGPDQQRPVTAVAGKFIPTDDLCPTQFTYDEAIAVISLVSASDLSDKLRLLAVLRAAVAPHEFALAAEAHRISEAAKLAELNKTLNLAFGLIKLEAE